MILFLSAQSFACGGDGDSEPTPTSSLQASVVRKAAEAFAAEGLLRGDIVSSDAHQSTVGEAREELTAWGATFGDYPDYPSLDTPAWVVRIFGYGIEPRPPIEEDIQRTEECQEMRAIVLEDPLEELEIMARPSDDC